MVMRRRVFPMVLAGAGIAACQLVLGIDRVDKPFDFGDGGADSSTPDLCAHTAPPPMPETDDDPNFELAPFLLAVRRLDVSDAGGTGFDLDRVCTCDHRPGAAYDGGGSCRGGGGSSCDDDGGVDNAALANILKSFEVFQSFDQTLDVNDKIAGGNTTILLLISGYNGRANDKDISVALILSEGIRDNKGCDAGANPKYPGLFLPGWCGNDIWTVDRDLVYQDAPPYQPVLATSGYVNQHRLVSSGENRVYKMLFASASIDLGSPIAVGTLTPLNDDLTPRDPNSPPRGTTDRLFSMEDGVFAGRLLERSLLEFAGSFPLPGTPPTYVCTSSFFTEMKSQLCAARDIAASKSLDFDPKTPCSALSLAYRFSAVPAVPGAAMQRPTPDNPCVSGPNALPNLDDLYHCPADVTP
jgi:hypothetical protein